MLIGAEPGNLGLPVLARLHKPALVGVVASVPVDDGEQVLSCGHFGAEPIAEVPMQEVPDSPYEVPIGKARVYREGDDVTLVAYGAMLQVASKAAEQAAEQGASVEVIDLRSICPLDVETVIDSVVKTGRAVILHEAPRTCGFGAELVAQINELLHPRSRRDQPRSEIAEQSPTPDTELGYASPRPRPRRLSRSH